MTEQTANAAPARGLSSAPIVFGVTVFASAALIFLVEPMIAKLVLPTLGGSPMVWNTCMAFFQAALLVGYAYAHLLQRVKSLKIQILIHAVVLFGAALVLVPGGLSVSAIMGDDPGTMAPGLWLMGVLALSLGPPFAALSATAPLAQAWYARVRSGEGSSVNPYVLYAASNLGSLIALLAYPTLVEPTLSLDIQTVAWSLGYGLFVILMLGAAYMASKSGAATPLAQVVEQEQLTRTITWKDRAIWVGLAAAPSSLMLGVTTHLTTDIASTPFLWVIPLALYLITFIIAFSSKPPIPSFYILVFQAALALFVAFNFTRNATELFSSQINLLIAVVFHLLAFFLTALMCHTGLAERRPHPSRLTEFYLLLSLGGVLGGAFNAFLAPLIFHTVLEYPVVLVLAALARPWGEGRLARWEILTTIAAFVAFAVILGLWAIRMAAPEFALQAPTVFRLFGAGALMSQLFLIIAAVCTFIMRDRALIFTPLLALMVLTPSVIQPRNDVVARDRSFFGVMRVSTLPIYGLSNKVHVLAHGTTLHGAQAREPELQCVPLVYYARPTPIGRVFAVQQAQLPSVHIGAVGMGTGSVAAFVREADTLRFFEIDQKIIDLATDNDNFSFINHCAKGKVDWVLGDARLKLEIEASDQFDILLVDAFSSDAVPAHLLTVEAMRTYLRTIKPDGVVIMHLSNRHLELASPVAAVVREAGGHGLYQYHFPNPELPEFADTGEEVIIVARNAAALQRYLIDDPSWEQSNDRPRVRAWTDDYTNIFGAMLRAL